MINGVYQIDKRLVNPTLSRGLLADSGMALFNDVMDINEIRLINLRSLIKGREAKKVFLEKLEMSPSQLSQIAGKNPTRPIGTRLARRIEPAVNKARGWLDQEHQINKPQVVEEERADYETVVQEIIKALKELPPGMQQHILRKVVEIKAYVDKLPSFIRNNLKPPRGEGYYQWERDLENDIAQRR